MDEERRRECEIADEEVGRSGIIRSTGERRGLGMATGERRELGMAPRKEEEEEYFIGVRAIDKVESDWKAPIF